MKVFAKMAPGNHIKLISILSVCVSLLLHSCTASPVRRTNPNEDPAVVDLGYAKYQGYLNKTSSLYLWRGIRFAEAERFQAPQTPSGMSGKTLDANKYGNICWQGLLGQASPFARPKPSSGSGSSSSSSAPRTGPAQSEDCLFLNVYAPAGACEGDNLPVLFWIHGGGYSLGDATSDFSSFLEVTGSKMVIVQIQYRLGVFGFLPGQAIKDNGVTNAGMLDQQFALQWTQRHVSKFGGNPDHVTIWGESAGAGSVLNQIIANDGNTVKALGLKKPLFKAGLGSSVFLPLQVKYNSPWAEHLYSQVVNASDCSQKSSSSFSCLKGVDAASLAATGLALTLQYEVGFWVYVPVIDGTFLTDRASVLLKEGKLNGQYFTGINNLDEGFIFTDPNLLTSATTQQATLQNQFDLTLKGLFPLLTQSQRQQVAQQYPIADAPITGNTFQRISTIIADSTFVCPTYWTTEAFTSSAYKGLFDYGTAYHGSDTAYYTGNIWNGKRSVSSVQSFTGALGGFILSYNPNNNPANSTINPKWPTFNTGQQLLFNTTTRNTLSEADPSIVSTSSLTDYGSSQTSKCDFWRGSISVNAGL